MHTERQSATAVDQCVPPLRIVHYIPGIRLSQGGIVRATLDWCTVFAERGHRVTLITYVGDDIPRDWYSGKSGKPRALTVPPPSLASKQLGRRAVMVAEEAIKQADVLHLHAPWSYGNPQLAKLAGRYGVPYVVSLHGMLDDWSMSQRRLTKVMYLLLFGRRLLAGAASVHCTAESESSQASKWFMNPNTVVLPYLVNLAPFELLPGPELGRLLLPPERRDERKLLFLGRLHPKKGVDILIRAASRLRDDGVPLVLMIAGNGEPAYESYLCKLVVELNLRERVFFLGLITGAQKVSLYQAADVFVLPTLQENFGLVLTEALACGTPVVTTRGADIWREIQQAGGIIADTTPASIAAAVGTLLTRMEDLPSLGERGRKWVFDVLATGPLAQRYEMLYRSLIKGTRSSCCGVGTANI